MNRAEMLLRLRTESAAWDVLVIGGGATGLGTALDAAARGYRTALIEQSDFAQATSSRSTKLIHGGVRYLQQGRLGLVRESLRERGRLLRNAPHLVHRLSFVIPNYAWWERPFYGTGLKLYDALAGNLGIGASEHLSRDEALTRIPTLEPFGLRGGILYHDGQFDDARLAVALTQTITSLIGVVVNYVKAVAVLKQNDRVCGIVAHDLEDGSEFELRARVVVNATGIFTDEVRRLDDKATPDLLTFSQGAHIVLDKSFLPGECALMLPRTMDGRVFFAIPWQGRTLIGTTETPAPSPAHEPRPLREEIEFLLAHAAHHLAKKPGSADILSAFAGLRPLVRVSNNGQPTSSLSRSHQVLISKSGLITITGGKWTTYRQMAEDTVNQAAKVGGLPARPSPTAELKLHGWQGSDSRENVTEGQTLLHPRLPYREADVLQAVRHEMARTVEDVLSRRMRVLMLDAQASIKIAPRVAQIMATELKSDTTWEDRQVAAFRELAADYLVK